MTADLSAFLADAWVSLCAALGALTVLTRMPSLSASPAIMRRYRFALWLLAIFLLARIGHWGDWGWTFSAVTNSAAALVPLAALLLAEGLQRRHAPALLKGLCSWGAVALILLGLLQFPALELPRVAALLAFQLVSLSAIAWFTLSRDRESLALAENQLLDRMALSFALILPFLATDYLRDGPVDLPVRLGGIAVLALCWLTISSNRAGLSRTTIVKGFAAVLGISAVLTVLLIILADMEARVAVQSFAAILAAILLLAVAQAATALTIEDSHHNAFRKIAEASGTGPTAAFELIKSAAGAPEAIIVAEDELTELDLVELRSRFQAVPVRQVSDTLDEQIAWLFARYAATHALVVSLNPLRLALLHSPAIAGADSSGDGLRVIQRTAASMAQEDQP